MYHPQHIFNSRPARTKNNVAARVLLMSVSEVKVIVKIDRVILK